jgi:two-component system, NarL family, invasion response regulator UvrY
VRILLVDDHAIVREGLQELLAALPDAQISEAATVDEALARVRDEQPTVIVLDFHLPGLGGLKLLRRLLAEYAEARVLVLDMRAEARCATETLRAGAAGYLSKNAPPEELLAAVCHVAENGHYIEAEIAQILALQSIRSDPVKQLTKREADIIGLLGWTLALLGRSSGVGHQLCQALMKGPGVFGGSCTCAPSRIIVPP